MTMLRKKNFVSLIAHRCSLLFIVAIVKKRRTTLRNMIEWTGWVEKPGIG